MQTNTSAPKFGATKGSEVARRLNANEDKLLQREVSRYAKEHQRAMRQIFNEKYIVREEIRDLRKNRHQRRISQGQKLKDKYPIDENDAALDLGALNPRKNNGWVAIDNKNNSVFGLSNPKEAGKTKMRRSKSMSNFGFESFGDRTDRRRLRRFASNVAHVSQEVFGSGFTGHKRRAKTADHLRTIINSAKHKNQRKNGEQCGIIKKQVEERSMMFTVDGCESDPSCSNEVASLDLENFDFETRRRSKSDVTTINLPRSSVYRPRTASFSTISKSEKRTQKQSNPGHTIPMIAVTELKAKPVKKRNLSLVEMKTLDVLDTEMRMKTTGNPPKLSAPKSASSLRVAANFRRVSEAVIVAQSLVKNARREQAIHKATAEIQAKDYGMLPRKVEEMNVAVGDTTIINTRAPGTAPKGKFIRTAHLLLAMNSLSRRNSTTPG